MMSTVLALLGTGKLCLLSYPEMFLHRQNNTKDGFGGGFGLLFYFMYHFALDILMVLY